MNFTDFTIHVDNPRELTLKEAFDNLKGNCNMFRLVHPSTNEEFLSDGNGNVKRSSIVVNENESTSDVVSVDETFNYNSFEDFINNCDFGYEGGWFIGWIDELV